MNNMNKTDFNFYVPLDMKKSISGDEHGRYVRGWASTPDVDLTGESIDPKGIDASLFLANGYINYEHREGSEYWIGKPTARSYVDPQRGLFVEAKLFDTPYADAMWELSKSIANGEDNPGGKVLGFSVEGSKLSDGHTIKKAVITNVALTTDPANPHALWESFIKSFSTGNAIGGTDQEGAAALRAESFAKDIKNLAMTLKSSSFDWKDVAKSLDNDDGFVFDNGTAALLLQIKDGISKEEALKRIG
ncbi:hypothetical protein RND61_15005 [Streptomyces sp. TRM76323]|uniref:Prohead protease n=1 Tax=Streptomyces tamarix TaxID=3078565 RepID=A0ABU3QKT6_9ACTN|nr:hypothetical protein [Streptomyces tamarix]MDT9683372.1 hypothetical protein [Streptomyces tamarix]